MDETECAYLLEVEVGGSANCDNKSVSAREEELLLDPLLVGFDWDGTGNGEDEKKQQQPRRRGGFSLKNLPLVSAKILRDFLLLVLLFRLFRSGRETHLKVHIRVYKNV